MPWSGVQLKWKVLVAHARPTLKISRALEKLVARDVYNETKICLRFWYFAGLISYIYDVMLVYSKDKLVGYATKVK